MPLTTIASYLTTLDDFLQHWGHTETVVGPFVLPDGTTQKDIAELRAEFAALQSEIAVAELEAGTARAVRDSVRQQIMPAITQFNASVRGAMGMSHPFSASLPNAPGGNVAYDRVLNAANTVVNVWGRINSVPAGSVSSFTPPLAIPDSFTQSGLLTLALFMERRDDFAAKIAVSLSAERDARHARDQRTILKARVSDGLTAYRTAIIARVRPKSTIRQTLPSLYPRPGSTPPPVTASGVWDKDRNSAVISISPLAQPVVDKFGVIRYAVRYYTGPGDYKVDEEQIVGTIALDQTTWQIDRGFSGRGDTMQFRVYAITKNGNERGGNIVVIEKDSVEPK